MLYEPRWHIYLSQVVMIDGQQQCWCTLKINVTLRKQLKQFTKFRARTACPKLYVGETGRLFRTRLFEHKTETEKLSAKNYTRFQRKASTSEIFKSAITEHVAASNHVIRWVEAKIIDLEPDKTTMWLREAIWIRSRGVSTMNKDEGAYKLDRIYDQIIEKRQPGSLVTSSKLTNTGVAKI